MLSELRTQIESEARSNIFLPFFLLDLLECSDLRQLDLCCAFICEKVPQVLCESAPKFVQHHKSLLLGPLLQSLCVMETVRSLLVRKIAS